LKSNFWSTIFGEKPHKKPDYILAVMVFGLVVFGLIVISSASVVVSYDTYGDSHQFLRDQLVSALIGMVAFVVAAKINYKFWQKNAWLMLMATLVFLFLVFIPGIGFEHGGARRWVSVGPIFFQPSEIIKLTFIVYLAGWLTKKGQKIKDFSMGYLPFLTIMAIIVALVMLQPDLGTMLVISFSASVLFFVAGAEIKHILLTVVAGGGLVWLLISLSPYRMARLTAFLKPEENILGIGYHVQQALVAIGSGGWLGRGFGRSIQKFSYLPEVVGDSIYAVMSEELGFIRMVIFLIVYVLLVIRGYQIARRAPDTFSRLLAVGITSWIGFQAFVNMAAMLALVPLTGLPLPFISFGGSSLIITLIGVGVLYNISQYSHE